MRKKKMSRICMFIFAMFSIYCLAIGPSVVEAKVVLKAVSCWKKNHTLTENFLDMIAKINARTKGQLEIQFIGGPEVIKARDLLSSVGDGTVDMMCGYNGYYAGLVPEGEIIGLPVVKWNAENTLRLAHSVMPELVDIYHKKANVLYLGPAGIAGLYFCSRTKPIRSIKDVKGLKVRSTGGIIDGIIHNMGGVPVKIPSPEIYTSAQRGIIDAGLRPGTAIKDWREYEIWKYVQTHPVYTMVHYEIWMNWDSFHKLPKKIQRIIKDVVAEVDKDNMVYFARIDKEALEFCKSKGVKLLTMSRENQDQWDSIVKKSAKEYFSEKGNVAIDLMNKLISSE